MFDLGTQELIVIFIVAFLVFGPRKLPELGRNLGKGLRDLKAAMRGVTESFEEAGSDVNNELKKTKSDLEDSVYKSIESGISVHEQTEDEEKTGPQRGPDPSVTSRDSADSADKKETDKDG